MMRAGLLGWGLAVALLVAGCSSYDGAPPAGVGAAGRAGPATMRRATTATTDRPAPARVSPARLPAARLLHAWDRRRARAWAAGDVRALADLYIPGSGAGRADVALLRRYLDRGLRVTGMRMQVFAVQVLGHRRGRWRLRVTDRLQRAIAVGDEGQKAVLPHGQAETRVLTLTLGADGRWRVARVGPARRG